MRKKSEPETVVQPAMAKTTIFEVLDAARRGSVGAEAEIGRRLALPVPQRRPVGGPPKADK